MPKKQIKLSGAALQVHKHPYRGDGHRVHRLDPVDPEVAETSQRITGERGGE